MQSRGASDCFRSVRHTTYVAPARSPTNKGAGRRERWLRCGVVRPLFVSILLGDMVGVVCGVAVG